MENGEWRMENERQPALNSPLSILHFSLFADVEFELPALRAVARDAPDFERADLRDARLKADGEHRVLLAVELERDFERAQLFEVVAPVFDQLAERVLLADVGAEESELGRLADDEAELARRYRGF